MTSDLLAGQGNPAPPRATPGPAGRQAAELRWRAAGVERSALWLAPSVPPPARVGRADDRTTAAAALARVRQGEALVHEGDYHLARQLLAAMARRLRAHRERGPGQPPRRGDAPARSPRELFRAEREQVRLEHELLSRLAVPIDPGWRIPLRRAPDVAAACEEALGPSQGGPGLLPLRDLLGLVGAHEWRRKGVEVPALGTRLRPHYGVYAPIRGEYVDLVAEAARAAPLDGKRAFDVGTGTGVLALVLARAGARVTATDLEPRAVACARENAELLGLAGRVEVLEADLFPPGAADLVVSNPPWLPAPAHTLLDRAVYDPGGAFLDRLLRGIPAHLAPGGEAWLVLSDLAERIGLRAPGEVEARAAAAGLAVAAVLTTRPTHPRAGDASDPLHAVRSQEVTRLFRLRPA